MDSVDPWCLLMPLPCFVLRCGHSGGLHLCVRSCCDKPPPLPAAAGPEEQQHQRGEQTQHVHRLQDRAAPPQLSQGQHEGVLHLTTVCALWTQDTNLPLSYKGLTGGHAASGFVTTKHLCALEVSQEHCKKKKKPVACSPLS